ncbi:MAG: hypothetical protein LBG83_01865 [Oscillospiraceae bacterium]|nr:hypothetical protein [Oscillospiraceae bacterium]
MERRRSISSGALSGMRVSLTPEPLWLTRRITWSIKISIWEPFTLRLAL